ncbi:MAG: hypothetical protein CXT73_04365 [Methanobacteriota archaeon]|nr:MAG: hypothetical protein CXT73_04365 [Euryarchaeota archaeon]
MKIVYKTQSEIWLPEDIWKKIIHEYILKIPHKKYWLSFRSFNPIIDELTKKNYTLYCNTIFDLTTIFLDKETATKYIPKWCCRKSSINIEIYKSLKVLLEYIYNNIFLINTRLTFITRNINIYKTNIWPARNLRKNKNAIARLCNRQVTKMNQIMNDTTNIKLKNIYRDIEKISCQIIYIIGSPNHDEHL